MLQAALMASLEEPHPRKHDDDPQAGDRSVASRDLEGAPYVRAEAQEELLALKSGAVFVCARPDGDIRAARVSGEGLYAQDTRHLSELRLTVGGVAPVLLSSTMESGHHAIVNATNPTLRDDDGAEVAQETVNVRRTVLVDDRLYYQVRVRNFGPRAITTTVEVVLAADFADVFDVRGVARRTSGRLVPPEREANRVRLAYTGEDGERRETVIELSPTPGLIALDGRGARATWEIALEPREATTLQITVDPARRDSVVQAPALEEASARLNAAHEAWEGACARITTDNELFDRFIDASVRDLHALMMPAPGGTLPAAGIPWYVAPFGRDSLLTACETLMVNPDVARGTLLVLAGLQAGADEPWRDAEPGKILHELRAGELARTGHIPHTPYYGTVDATPLFLALAGGVPPLDRWTSTRWPHCARRSTRRSSGSTGGATATATGSSSTSAAPRQACATTAGRTPTTRSCTPTGRWPKARSRSSRSRATSTRPSCGSPRSTTHFGDTARAELLRGEAQTLRAAFNDAFWDAGGGLLRARARRTQGAGPQRHVEPRALPVLRDRRRRQGRTRGRAADGAGHVLRLGSPDAVERLAGVQPDELPQRLGVAARQRDRRGRAQALRISRRDGAHRRRAVRRRRRSARLPAARAVLRLSSRWLELDRGLSRWPASHRPGRLARPSCCCRRCWASRRMPRATA